MAKRPHDGDRQRCRPDFQQPSHVGLKPDRKQQNHHTELGKQMNRLQLRIHQPQHDFPTKTPPINSPQHRGLPGNAAAGYPRSFCGDKHYDQDSEEL